MFVPDPTPTLPVSMIHAPIAADGGDGQVSAALPFQDHHRVQKPGLLEHSIQTIEREHPEPTPLGDEIPLTLAGDIVLDLMVGMKFVAIVSRVRFKWQTMRLLGLTIDTSLGLLG